VKYSHDGKEWFKYGADSTTTFPHVFKDDKLAFLVIKWILEDGCSSYAKMEEVEYPEDAPCLCASCSKN